MVEKAEAEDASLLKNSRKEAGSEKKLYKNFGALILIIQSDDIDKETAA